MSSMSSSNDHALTSVDTRRKDSVLVKLPIRKTTLTSEAPLEVSELVVHHTNELSVVAANSLLGKLDNFVCLGSESVDGIA
jgi:hypothetical protein